MVAPADPMLKGKSPDMGSLRPKKTKAPSGQKMSSVVIERSAAGSQIPLVS